MLMSERQGVVPFERSALALGIKLSLTGMPHCEASDGERSASVAECFTGHLWCDTWHWPRFCHSSSVPFSAFSTSISHHYFIYHRLCVTLPTDIVVKQCTTLILRGMEASPKCSLTYHSSTLPVTSNLLYIYI